MKLLYLFLLVPFVISPVYGYNIGFTPVYQPSGAVGGSPPTELYCIFGDFLNSFNSTTNSFTCGTPTSSGGGENNTASNIGLGEDIFKQKTGVNLEFKGIAVAGDLSISSNDTDITISYTDPAGGSGNATVLNDLGDVATAPTFGEVLYYDGNTWVDHILILQQDMGDVLITLAERGDFLFYDGINWIDKTFSINSVTCVAGEFVNVINNQTGETSCDPPSGSGFTSIASAPQTTATILSDNSSSKATIKTLTQGTGITITNGSNAVTIATTAGAFKNPLLDGSNHTDTTSSSPPNRGDLITGSSSNLWDDLPIGTSGKVLTSNGTDASWQTPAVGGGMTTMKKTADQTINAGAAVYTDITDLSFPVTNGVDYAFHYYIVFRSSATATGFKCSVNGPAGTVDYFMTYQTVANAASGAAGVATWLQAHQIVYDAGFLNLTTITANADLVCIIDGRYKSTADGTFTARFANELAANTNIVVQKGSYGWWF